MRRTELPPDSFGARLNAAITRRLGDRSDRSLMLELARIGHKISEPTINRDRKCRVQNPPKGRVEVWSKLLGLPQEALMPAVAPCEIQKERGIVATDLNCDRVAPASPGLPDESRWVVCPNKWCATATWKNGIFVEYGWFDAEQEGRFCRKCASELVYGCTRPDCQKLARPLRKGDRYCGDCGAVLLPLPEEFKLKLYQVAVARLSRDIRTGRLGSVVYVDGGLKN